MNFPFNVDVAIATSGPALGIYEFEKYMTHFDDSFKNLASPTCYSNIGNSIKFWDDLLDSDFERFKELAEI